MIRFTLQTTLDETALAQVFHGAPDSQIGPRPRFRQRRQVGDVGEIRIDGASSPATKLVRTRHGRRAVTYAKLITAQQAARANDNRKKLFGPRS